MKDAPVFFVWHPSDARVTNCRGSGERKSLMAENIFSIDQSKSMGEQEVPGHNRWHPDIPAVASVDPGTEFRMDCREWTDG